MSNEENLKLARIAMAHEQSDLIAALLCGAPSPAGFDAERLQSASQALVRKRVRCMQRANSVVHEICPQDNYSILEGLHQFIRENPSVHPQGPYEDSLAFLAYIGLKSAAKPSWGLTFKARLTGRLKAFLPNF